MYIIIFVFFSLSNQQACASSGLDFLFRQLGEVLGFDNDWNIDLTISQKLEDSMAHEIDNWSLSATILGSVVDTLTGNVENFVQVARWSEGAVF